MTTKANNRLEAKLVYCHGIYETPKCHLKFVSVETLAEALCFHLLAAWEGV